MDCALSPVQQRNLEKAWGAKVLDRTGLILEIFGRRARTREGALQVELAHLTYQKSRLVRTWTHLERQRGGFGFLGGPGETQIESDRRMIEERIARIEAELEKVKRTRKLHRDSRKRVPYPIVALVGYTNAGKSTLFNRMTPGERAVRRHAVRDARSDFARSRAAARRAGHPVRHRRLHFRSADHAGRGVPRDARRGDRGRRDPARARRLARGRRSAVARRRRGAAGNSASTPDDGARLVEVWNKIDRLDRDAGIRLRNRAERQPVERRPVLVSALSGEGIDLLATEIEARLATRRVTLDLVIDAADGAGVSWLHRHTEVMTKVLRDDGALAITVRSDPANAEKVRAKFNASGVPSH